MRNISRGKRGRKGRAAGFRIIYFCDILRLVQCSRGSQLEVLAWAEGEAAAGRERSSTSSISAWAIPPPIRF